jgi:hypothetical protein
MADVLSKYPGVNQWLERGAVEPLNITFESKPDALDFAWRLFSDRRLSDQQKSAIGNLIIKFSVESFYKEYFG